MSKIIHNPSNLINLDRDAIDEILLEDYKNPALLRELTRRTLEQLKEQTKMTEFYRKRKNDTLDKLDNVKKDINNLIDKYRN